jgi:hypothetical protein
MIFEGLGWRVESVLSDKFSVREGWVQSPYDVLGHGN